MRTSGSRQQGCDSERSALGLRSCWLSSCNKSVKVLSHSDHLRKQRKSSCFLLNALKSPVTTTSHEVTKTDVNVKVNVKFRAHMPTGSMPCSRTCWYIKAGIGIEPILTVLAAFAGCVSQSLNTVAERQTLTLLTDVKSQRELSGRETPGQCCHGDFSRWNTEPRMIARFARSRFWGCATLAPPLAWLAAFWLLLLYAAQREVLPEKDKNRNRHWKKMRSYWNKSHHNSVLQR